VVFLVSLRASAFVNPQGVFFLVRVSHDSFSISKMINQPFSKNAQQALTF